MADKVHIPQSFDLSQAISNHAICGAVAYAQNGLRMVEPDRVHTATCKNCQRIERTRLFYRAGMVKPCACGKPTHTPKSEYCLDHLRERIFEISTNLRALLKELSDP